MEPQQQPHTSPWVVPFSIIVAGALIGGGIYMSSKAPVKNQGLQNNQRLETINVKPVSSSDHIRGNPNAPVVIIEFSDTECPYCKQFHQSMKSIIDNYGPEGKVAWVYRHLPIDSLHARARKEAEASECAAELGGNEGFWKYIDKIYEKTNSNDSLDPNQLPVIAKEIGIDEKKFNECLSSGRHAEKVREQEKDGQTAGARGTPYSVIIAPTGEKVSIEGAQPYEVMKGIIDTALAQ